MNENYILVVDDDKEITEAIEIYLIGEGYRVIKAYDGIQALKALDEHNIDLIIMDVMMPNMDGMRATMKIRESREIPIIILSAKSEDHDKILGLNIGADDYITKPFNPLELIARVNSQIRRYKKFTSLTKETPTQTTLVVGGIELNRDSREILVDGKLVKLTPREFAILELLMNNPGRVFSIEEIYEKVWNEIALNADTVTVHIRRIREKIEINPKEPRYIKVVWGIGYKVEKQ